MQSNAQGFNWRQLLVLLLAIPVVAVSALLGVFVLVAVLGFALLGIAAFTLRLWWLRRKFARTRTDDVLEGEYVVVRDDPRRNSQRLR